MVPLFSLLWIRYAQRNAHMDLTQRASQTGEFRLICVARLGLDQRPNEPAFEPCRYALPVDELHDDGGRAVRVFGSTHRRDL